MKRFVAYLLIVVLLASISFALNQDALAEARSNAVRDGKVTVLVSLNDVSLGSAGLDARRSQNAVIRQGFLSRLKDRQKGRISTAGQDIIMMHEFATSSGFVARVTPSGLDLLASVAGIKNIMPNRQFKLQLAQSVPQIKADAVWNRTVNSQNLQGQGVGICILDSGIDYSHPAFQGRIVAGRCFHPTDCMGDVYNASDNAAGSHGTHVAGIATGNGSYVGVAPAASIIAVKVCGSGTSCDLAAMSMGMDWCVNESATYNISVITMSIGDGGYYTEGGACPGYDDTLENAIDVAWQQGIVFTAASGNYYSGSPGVNYPACRGNATAVGSVTKSDVQSTFSQRGSLLRVMAPGESITSTVRGGGYGSKDGTSMATPHAAGAAALLAQNEKLQGRNITPGKIQSLLLQTSIFVSGYPRVDVLSALMFANENLSMNRSANKVEKQAVGSVMFGSSTVLDDFDQCAVISYNKVEVNSSKCPQFNKSATLQLANLSFSGNVVPLRDGVFCDDCIVLDGSKSSFTFNVSHFSAYTAGSATFLTIWDSTDASSFLHAGLARFPNTVVTMYANFTNATGLPANLTDGGCKVSFNPFSTWQDMSFDATDNLFAFNNTFPTVGNHTFRINCTGQGDVLSLQDDVTISSAHVPEFGTWALLIGLGLTMAGLVFMRHRNP